MAKSKVAKEAFKAGNKTSTGGMWIFFIWVFTFFIAGIMTLVTSNLMQNASVLVASIILLVIIVVSILFDIIGTAVTAAEEVPFHSMAARRVYGAKTAIKLLKSADKVSNVCNDVIGDICGIISGSASTYIVLSIATLGNLQQVTYIEVLMGAMVAALTIGGKSIGKKIAINNSNQVIYKVAVVIRFFKGRE